MVHPQDVEQVKKLIMEAVSSSVALNPNRGSCVLWQQLCFALAWPSAVRCFRTTRKLIGACMDVTEYTQTIDRLHTSEARPPMVDHASDGLVLHDENGSSWM